MKINGKTCLLDIMSREFQSVAIDNRHFYFSNSEQKEKTLIVTSIESLDPES